MPILALLLFASDPIHSESPYFFVEGAEPGVDALPLKDTAVDISVSGVIAEVKVVQTYANTGTTPLHARYVFPASTRAAVHGLRMQIGDQWIVAQIKERGAAQKQFEQAKAEGKSASLLAQDRPNIFTMNVANILPSDTIRVELSYTELIVPTDGVYELVFPTVVGPRYTGTGESPTGGVPFLREGVAPKNAFHLSARVNAGMTVRDLCAPSHPGARLSGEQITLDDGAANKDFILRYRLAGDKIASGLMLSDDGYFLLMAEPPRRVDPAMIPPREYIFVLDVSGSMHGFPLNTAKAVMRGLFAGMRPKDSFNVVLFSGQAATLAPRSLSANEANVADALAIVNRQTGGGGTELLAALQTAHAIPKTAGVSRSVVVVTDGYIAEEAEAFAFIRAHLNDTNVFSFGIGSSVNRHLIEGVAKAGMGEAFVVTDATGADEAATKLRTYIEAPVLTQLSLEVSGLETYDLEPATLPDVFASRPVIVSGKWRGAARGTVTLRGKSGDGMYAQSFDVAPSASHPALRQLWARSRLATISDLAGPYESDLLRQQITDLGLEYHLLTKHTSFIAVHEEVRRAPSTPAAEVRQPLPLPEGVSNMAVPVTQGAEPELILLMLLLAAVFVWRARRCATF